MSSEDYVLPARAGMSPVKLRSVAILSGAPRTGGDEPNFMKELIFTFECSPHGRG